MVKPTILILHGWGRRERSYNDLISLLANADFSVFAPDFPGFDGQSLPREALTLDDYVDFTKAFIKRNVNGKYIIIGHSFGGRIAIKLAASHPSGLAKLVLTGAAGIRHPLPLRSKIAFFCARNMAWVFTLPLISSCRELFRKALYRFVGEFDYYRAGKLRETFKNVIGEDLSYFLPKISAPTLIVWGEEDVIVPLSDGKFMNKKIEGSKFIVVKGAGHNLPIMMPNVFVEKILPFINA